MRTAGVRKEVAIPTVPLPDDPNVEQLRKQSKELRDQSRRGVPEALELVAEYHPKGAHAVSPRATPS
jgi:hypothetical protein